MLALGVLMALLVGGRFVAIETAERAWAVTLGSAGADVYLATRDFARLVRGLVLLVAIAWGVANFYNVYRAIGSVQLPRRLGDLEIVEAVPQRTLLGITIALGLAFGLLLAMGTGDWWLETLLASKPPRFGVTDPVLHRDLGFYLGALPWAVTLQRFALRATLAAVLVIALLYLGIGSLRFTGWRPTASAHARTHLGVLLALLGVALLRGAMLDPAEVVAGLHGSLDRGALVVRLPGAPFVAVCAAVACIASIVWIVRDHNRALGMAWAALLAVALLVYLIVPNIVRGGVTAPDVRIGPLERIALGAEWNEGELPHGFPTLAAALSHVPVWDPDRVGAMVRRSSQWSRHAQIAGAALTASSPGASGPASAPLPRWLVVPSPTVLPAVRDSTSASSPLTPPAWNDQHRGALAHTDRPLAALEIDSGLALTPVATRDSVFWYGPGFREFAVAAPDTWPETRTGGIPLSGWWRRTALAWVLQSPELARHETDGVLLLWRRDAAERLSRLAPFATFDDPIPLVTNRGTLMWLSYGYLASDYFPLSRGIAWPDGSGDELVRYLRVGLVGVVDAARGTTVLYLAPGADSLATAWGRIFAPLIQPADSLPEALGTALPFPRDAFRAAVVELLRSRGDSAAWQPRPREPYELIAPRDSSDSGMRMWMAQGFETGTPAQFAALLGATMSPRGPIFHVWRAAGPTQFPTDLLGSPETAPGLIRIWTAGGSLVTEQGLFVQPATTESPKGLSQVYITWGDRAANGPTPSSALHNLLTGTTPALPADTSLTARWEAVRRLAAAADSALSAGNLEAFGRLYGELTRLLGVGTAHPGVRPHR
ncbi:MAG TPA: UPF0182 family protein [Gemmatimonadales bacterium]|nr:UPF0182 family protein [Gemmatimonadales bacterium]